MTDKDKRLTLIDGSGDVSRVTSGGKTEAAGQLHVPRKHVFKYIDGRMNMFGPVPSLDWFVQLSGQLFVQIVGIDRQIGQKGISVRQ